MITDYFGKDAAVLGEKKIFLLDMDGTIYTEGKLFPGTLEFLEHIRQSGGQFVFITNNSSKSVQEYVDYIQNLGISVNEDSFFTSTQATALYLNENYPQQKVYVQATKSCCRELRQAGVDVCEELDEHAGVVLVGFDTELTFEKIRNTSEMLGHDVAFIATNPDLVCPVSFGFVPDCGSVCKMLENATGRKPVYIGKPEPFMVRFVCRKYGCTADEAVIVGDRLYTDIAAGSRAGIDSICVLTGEASVDDILRGSVRPTFTFPSVAEILSALKSAHTWNNPVGQSR